MAEDTYVKTTKRCDDGRYMVKLPFKTHPTKSLGDSLHIAKQRYTYMQKRLNKNPEFRKQYNQCINEYLELNHIIQSSRSQVQRQGSARF